MSVKKIEIIEGRIKTFNLLSEKPHVWEVTYEIPLTFGSVVFKAQAHKRMLAEMRVVKTMLEFCPTYEKLLPNLPLARQALGGIL